MKTPLFIVTVAGFLFAGAHAETVKDRKGAVLEDRTRMQDDARWIYNDWRRGFEEAKRTGKPLLVVLRCVPCLACAGIDASVLTQEELQPLLDQFICVRVINANALDLSLFQFDYDLSFSTMIFNGDGTVYGRYGSWTHQRNSFDRTISGYKSALEGSLRLHRDYPANKESLAGKQGKPMPVKDPLELPELAGKYKRELDWEGKVVQSCVHCHQVGDAMRAMERSQSKTIPQKLIYPMPNPETIGLSLASDSAARIQSVKESSVAARAGLQAGDELLSLEKQPIISEADVAWVLHHSPNEGKIHATVKRGEKQEIPIEIALPRDWRMQSDIARRVGTWPMRAMATGGIFLKDLTDAERKDRNFPINSLGLRAEHVGEYGEHAAAKKAGFRKEDVLVEVDGISERISESELIGRLLEKHKPGTKIEVTVLRGDESLKLQLPMQ